MNDFSVLESQWSAVLSMLPPGLDLERSARESGALMRKREVRSASDLLRLALVYGFCGYSLRQTAAWAEVSGLGTLSDVAVLKRLRHASKWLGYLLGELLASRTLPVTARAGICRLKLVDATCVSRPGSTGTDWRIHLSYDLLAKSIDQADVTDAHGGETLLRFSPEPGDLYVADRGYAHRRGLAAMGHAGGDFIVRLNWQNVPMQHPDGKSFDVIQTLRGLSPDRPGDFPVLVAPDPRHGLPAQPARFVAIAKSPEAAANSRRQLLKEYRKKSKRIDLNTLEAAGYIFVLTSVGADRLTGTEVLDIYRFRWQVELVFKRLKSLLHLDDLQAKDPDLARCFIYAKLIGVLLLDALTRSWQSFSPWGYASGSAAAVAVADTAGATRKSDPNHNRSRHHRQLVPAC